MTTAHPNGPTPECLSQLVLDELQAGDAEETLATGYRAHLESCAHCRGRLEAAAREAEAFLQRVPNLQALGEQVQGRVSPPPATGGVVLRMRKLVPLAAGALAAAAALLLVIDTGSEERTGVETQGPVTRSKGSAHLGVYIHHLGRVRKGHNGDVVHPGDTLRFVYTSDRDTHLALFGSDGSELVRYYPAQAEHMQPAPRGSGVPLDFGVELDEATGVETFYGVFCGKPEPLAGIRSGLLDAAAPRVPGGCALDVLRLDKRSAP